MLREGAREGEWHFIAVSKVCVVCLGTQQSAETEKACGLDIYQREKPEMSSPLDRDTEAVLSTVGVVYTNDNQRRGSAEGP